MDLQIKKYPKTDAKILSISPLSVFSARQSLMGETTLLHLGRPQDRAALSLWFVDLDNLFLGNP
jgi:hypothetical protein